MLTWNRQSADGVIIRWGDYFSKIDRGRNSTFHTATLLVQGDDFRAENLTIENTAGPVGQALALSVEADRCVFENCRMLGNQDTLYADGANTRQYYRNCYIEGTTDFIFGGATALFEDCTIHSKANSFITAASTPVGRPFGFVFLQCKLTATDSVNKVFLGRPWRSHAKTVFVKCEMGGHIRPEGWNNWSSPEKERTVYYAEGGNTGPGADTANRVSWAMVLPDEEVMKYCAKEVLKPFLLPEMITSTKSLNIPRDTTYTLQIAYEKYNKNYPFIRAIEYDKSKGTMRQADVCYHSVNRRPLSLDIFSTTGDSGPPKPAVVLIHGGGWSSGDRSLMYPLADNLANHGYIAIPAEYRLSPEAKWPGDGTAQKADPYRMPDVPEWVHIAFTFTLGTGGAVYINSEAQTLIPWNSSNDHDVSPSAIAAEIVNIGRDTFNQGTLTNTKIDDFKFYNVALSAEDVAAIYNAEKTAE